MPNIFGATAKCVRQTIGVIVLTHAQYHMSDRVSWSTLTDCVQHEPFQTIVRSTWRVNRIWYTVLLMHNENSLYCCPYINRMPNDKFYDYDTYSNDDMSADDTNNDQRIDKKLPPEGKQSYRDYYNICIERVCRHF